MSKRSIVHFSRKVKRPAAKPRERREEEWRPYARKRVGDEMYEKMMEIAAPQKRQAAEERQKKEATA